ncbi:GntR family transcriptional regulator [Denitratisoma oestradiolicum]|uniref:GntR family transcriptional regulator n=1 Tax=Denitratisoma oestradiolicum TaxID=311182 RepID=A0A6S6XZE3_9PROT|nr:GntR family transcriptional regulator [Denitratisoma oestradiolicum]TWO79643.1 GntR family transcriptional regulator [Denitratisoma oestradiolicum]CAB1370448.1 GntR family transcriptional regulator [Denitratisoma oestradiolicum]
MNAIDSPIGAVAGQTIARTALYQEVAERLRVRIFAHDMAPGSWVDEQALADEFGISRTPMREALKVLAAEGLVVLKPRRGCYVAELSEQDLDEVFPVMALLEGRAALEAAGKASDADLARLAALHAELERHGAAADADRFFAVNDAFHAALQEIAGNRWLQHLIDDTRKMIKLTRRHSLLVEGRLDQSLAEHRQILEALQARNPERAARAMHDHLLSGREALAKLGSTLR